VECSEALGGGWIFDGELLALDSSESTEQPPYDGPAPAADAFG